MAVLGIFLLLALTSNSAVAQSPSEAVPGTVTAVRSIADGVIAETGFCLVDRASGRRLRPSEAEGVIGPLAPDSPYSDWRYWNGVLNIAMIRLGEVLKDDRYARFAARNIAFGFEASEELRRRYRGEDKWVYPFGQFFVMRELDDCGAMGASVIEVERSDRQPSYRDYIERSALHILYAQHHLADGTLARNFPQPGTIWADDLYMSLSFLSRYAVRTGREDVFADAVRQVLNYHARLFDVERGMMSHCWYSEERRRGPAFWGRANGWALLGQLELLERLPHDHTARDTLVALLRRHVSGIARYQRPNGLWSQLLDRPETYDETSCSAMFTYVIARAVQLNIIAREHQAIADRGWHGIVRRIRPDGRIEGVCAGTVVSDDLDDYAGRPTPLNDVHGIGAVILAGTAMLGIGTAQ